MLRIATRPQLAPIGSNLSATKRPTDRGASNDATQVGAANSDRFERVTSSSRAGNLDNIGGRFNDIAAGAVCPFDSLTAGLPAPTPGVGASMDVSLGSDRHNNLPTTDRAPGRDATASHSIHVDGNVAVSENCKRDVLWGATAGSASAVAGAFLGGPTSLAAFATYTALGAVFGAKDCDFEFKGTTGSSEPTPAGEGDPVDVEDPNDPGQTTAEAEEEDRGVGGTPEEPEVLTWEWYLAEEEKERQNASAGDDSTPMPDADTGAGPNTLSAEELRALKERLRAEATAALTQPSGEPSHAGAPQVGTHNPMERQELNHLILNTDEKASGEETGLPTFDDGPQRVDPMDATTQPPSAGGEDLD